VYGGRPVPNVARPDRSEGGDPESERLEPSTRRGQRQQQSGHRHRRRWRLNVRSRSRSATRSRCSMENSARPWRCFSYPGATAVRRCSTRCRRRGPMRLPSARCVRVGWNGMSPEYWSWCDVIAPMRNRTWCPVAPPRSRRRGPPSHLRPGSRFPCRSQELRRSRASQGCRRVCAR
jgi:hypothetical protein